MRLLRLTVLPFLLALAIAGEPGEAVAALDAIDAARAMRQPAWGFAAIARADPVLAAAIAAGKAGDGKPMAAWMAAAAPAHLSLVTHVAMEQSELPGLDETIVVALHPLYEAMLAGMPAEADGLRVAMANHLAYSLVARATPPTAAELARAGVLADALELDLQRPEVARGRNGHGIADTVACVRFLQGERARAAGLWRRALALTLPGSGSLYRRRLAAAETADAPLPR